MGRGIMNHSNFKTFLTAGIFGKMFRPILYSKVDKIQFDFLGVIVETIKGIDNKINIQNKRTLKIWFCMAPKELFELLFLPDENNKVMVPVLEHAEFDSGKECAYLTQGFILYQLEQIIKNSNEYSVTTKLNLQYIEDTCDMIFGKDNQTRKHLDHYRRIFNNNQTDPRDNPISFVYDTTRLFIYDKKKQRSAIQEWDDDLISKYNLINDFIEFIARQKDNSLKITK